MMNKNQFTVRDLLAFDRTHLANERTFLAYVRTFIGMVGAGAALLKIFDIVWLRTVAYILLILGPLLFIFGIVRFIKVRGHLKHYCADAPPLPDDHRGTDCTRKDNI